MQDGTSGYVQVLSKTEASGPTGEPFCSDGGMWNRKEHSIYVHYDSTGGSQTIYLYSYDRRF